jgi:hypothetical protein
MKGKRIHSTIDPSFPPDLCSHPPVPLAGVYASTYLTANWTKALCDEYDVDYKVRGHVSPWCIHTQPCETHRSPCHVTPTSCIGCRSWVPLQSSSQLISLCQTRVNDGPHDYPSVPKIRRSHELPTPLPSPQCLHVSSCISMPA